MQDLIREIEEALGCVEQTIDHLRARGHEELAFQLAQLQFSSAIRTSWPGNLAPLARELGRIAEDASLGLAEDERQKAARAALTFKRLCNV